MMKDDYVIVLDFLPHGKPTDRKAEPIIQAIGEKFLNLVGVIIKEGVVLKTLGEVCKFLPKSNPKSDNNNGYPNK